MRTTLGIVIVLLFLALFLILGPALLLWAVGTLIQGEGLDFTFWNWLAAAVILMLFNASASRN